MSAMPTTIGRYQIIRPLGAGGMADVYLANDPVLNRQVAIKVPRLQAQALARFDVEARAVARLEHPAIVSLYEYGHSEGRPFLVMRHMRGGSLADRLRRGPLPPAQVLPILARIAAALDFAHGQGVIHRDVKPANILFDEAGAAYLSDFGIARIETQAGPRLTVVGAVPGSPAYLSPEQARGERDPDGRSDIFSLGVVAYEMLTGVVPFPLGPAQMIAGGVPSIAQRRPDLPPAVQPVIARALATDPAARYGRAADLVADLGRALGGAARPAGKGGIPIWLIAGGVVAALAVLWLLMRPGGDTSATPTRRATAVAGSAAPASTTSGDVTFAPTATVAASPTDTVAVETADPAGSPTPFSSTFVVGRTGLQTPILGTSFGHGPQKLVFVGGITGGYAPGTIDIAMQAVDYFEDNPQAIPETMTVYIIPAASPDTPVAPGEYRGRLNANGVDINRNWDCQWAADSAWGGEMRVGNGGSGPFSEVESRALRDFILNENPAAVVIWYARANDGMVSPGGCGVSVLVSDEAAGIYGRAAGYAVSNFGDLPGAVVNGDATNWLDANRIPAVSVLLPNFEDADWGNNLKGILALIEAYSGRPTPAAPAVAAVPLPAGITPETAARASTCPQSPGERWGTALWSRFEDRLFCALNQVHGGNAAYQYFEKGTAIWREDNDRIYFLYDDGTYASYRDDEGPPGYYDSPLLKGGFGYMWNTYPAIRDRLGQPLAAEANAPDFAVQDFEGGVLLYYYERGGHNHALFNDNGTWASFQ
ncbi:MAG: protein kinase [Anaerolineae bacterium]|nr:protein kinase [Anaerolineae bacterium]